MARQEFSSDQACRIQNKMEHPPVQIMHPEVSVVIPAYNAARFIKHAIDSALSQSLTPSEIIVVDDGSTDDTGSIVNKYDGKVKYIYQANAGAGAARNQGVREARGEWVAFLDSDDFWDENHLELLLKHVQGLPEAVLAYSGKRWVDREGHEILGVDKQTTFPSGWSFSEMFAGNHISTTSVVVVKRSSFNEVGGFDERLRISQDYDLWLRIAAVAPICGVPAYTLNYRRHDSNLTLQTVRLYKEDILALMEAVELILRKMVDSRNNLDSIDIQTKMQQTFTSAIVGMFHIGEYREVRSLGLSAIRLRYVTIPFLVLWLLSWFPDGVMNGVKRLLKDVKQYVDMSIEPLNQRAI